MKTQSRGLFEQLSSRLPGGAVGGVFGRLLLPVAVLLSTQAAGGSPPSRREAVRAKVTFVGIDGASWKVIGPLLERGELPAFRRLCREGAYQPRLATLEPTISPVIWTTIATGARPEVHGITSFTSQLPNGQLIPVSSLGRRARAIWEIASRRGLSVGVIGWWGSWPAEEVNGYVVSDHANPAFSELLIEDGRYWNADPRTLTALRKDFFPPEIASVLARHWISRDDFPWDEIARRGAFSEAQMEALRAAPWNERNAYSWLKTYFRVDLPLLRASLDLARERPTDLQMLYLRGPDPIQHYGWDLFEPAAFAREPLHLARDRGLVEGVYRYVDSFLADLLAARRDDQWLIVASDHGAEAAPRALDPTFSGRPGEHGPGAKGVLMLLGPSIRAGTVLAAGTPYDLMPTLAWLLGLPIADDLPGRPLTEAFDDAFVLAQPTLRVPSYGPRPTGPLLPSPQDEAMLQSLRSLGYLQ